MAIRKRKTSTRKVSKRKTVKKPVKRTGTKSSRVKSAAMKLVTSASTKNKKAALKAIVASL